MNSYLKFPIIFIPNAGTINRPMSLRKTFESDLCNKSNLPEVKPKRGSVEKNKLYNINFLTYWHFGNYFK